MVELLKDVGAVAGLASFLGLALLALLYFAQARDLRRLRENASFLVEGGSADGESTAPAERPAAAVAAKEPEQAAAAAAASAPTEAEAFRRAELSRQAAERRQRFERRRRPGRERPAWMSEPSSIAVVVIGAILLIAGVAFGVTRLVGGGEGSTTKSGATDKGPCPPSQTKVAVFNGTATPGLAAQFAAPLKQNSYKTTPIGNTESPVATSVVMYDPQTGTACAPVISKIVGIQKQQQMSPEIQGLAEGDPVAVVLGNDQAGGAGATGASGTTASGI